MLTCRDKHTHPFCPSRLSVAADKKEEQKSDLLRLTAQYCGLSLKANALNVKYQHGIPVLVPVKILICFKKK